MDWWLRDRKTGRVVVVQFPNATLGVWMGASALQRVFGDVTRAEMLRWIAGGALLAWGVDELVRGANPFRRVLGAAALAYEAYAIVRVLRGM
ncbi:MAG: hypothetical protein Q8S73_42915 [Deltaproteobacteria bacterium]|nr:hypothetical protein [Deltaproteobacteria bacterium]